MIFGPTHTRSIDFYTLGCLIYEIITGFPPFYSMNFEDLGYKIMTEELRYPKNLLSSAKDLVEWLLNKDPNLRPKEFSEVKNHVFFENLHWGKLAKKQVIPPWVPSLDKCHFDPVFTRLPPRIALSNQFEEDGKRSIYLEQITQFVANSSIMKLFKKPSPEPEKIDPKISERLKEYWLDTFDFEAHPVHELMMTKQLNSFSSFLSEETADSCSEKSSQAECVSSEKILNRKEVAPSESVRLEFEHSELEKHPDVAPSELDKHLEAETSTKSSSEHSKNVLATSTNLPGSASRIKMYSTPVNKVNKSIRCKRECRF